MNSRFMDGVHLFVPVARVSLTIIVLRPFVRIANSAGYITMQHAIGDVVSRVDKRTHNVHAL